MEHDPTCGGCVAGVNPFHSHAEPTQSQGQDRESYTDDQDRESYTVEPTCPRHPGEPIVHEVDTSESPVAAVRFRCGCWQEATDGT